MVLLGDGGHQVKVQLKSTAEKNAKLVGTLRHEVGGGVLK